MEHGFPYEIEYSSPSITFLVRQEPICPSVSLQYLWHNSHWIVDESNLLLYNALRFIILVVNDLQKR